MDIFYTIQKKHKNPVSLLVQNFTRKWYGNATYSCDAFFCLAKLGEHFCVLRRSVKMASYFQYHNSSSVISRERRKHCITPERALPPQLLMHISQLKQTVNICPKRILLKCQTPTKRASLQKCISNSQNKTSVEANSRFSRSPESRLHSRKNFLNHKNQQNVIGLIPRYFAPACQRSGKSAFSRSPASFQRGAFVTLVVSWNRAVLGKVKLEQKKI